MDLKESSSTTTINSKAELVNTRNPQDGNNNAAAVSVEIPMIRRYITAVVLFVVNLLNYMDRYTIAGKVYCNYGNDMFVP